MKKILVLLVLVLLMACVTTKPDEKIFVGVEKQELPVDFEGKKDEIAADAAESQEAPAGTPTGEEVSTTIIVVDDAAADDVVIVVEASPGSTETMVVETQSNGVTVPETNLVALRSTDAERLGIIFSDVFALKNYENMLELARSKGIHQIVVQCSSGNQAVYSELFPKLADANINFYLLFKDYLSFYNNRELISGSPAIKGVIFWYEYWNFIQFKYKTRREAFDTYIKQLGIVAGTARQYGLMCYTVVDWFTLEELQKILGNPLQGVLLIVDDERIGIEEYINTNLQLVRMTGLPVSWGIMLNYKPKASMGDQTDSNVIKLMKLYRDDPLFQGIIFLY